MGWAGGSSLAENIWDAIKDHLPKEVLAEVAASICLSFEADLYEAEDLYTTALKDAEYFVETYLRHETFDYERGFSYDLKSFQEYLEDFTNVDTSEYSNRMLRKILKVWEKRSKQNAKG